MERATATPFVKLGSLPDMAAFRACCAAGNWNLPCDESLLPAPQSPLAFPATVDGLRIGNRWTIQPMEGWDGTLDGLPSENTFRRWRRFGESGAKLIWGGEAVAVRHEGRASPNQLLLNAQTQARLAQLRETLVAAHREAYDRVDDLVVGLQLTHSGRYSKPNHQNRPEPRILFQHPLLDRRQNLPSDYPLLTDGDLRALVADYAAAARRAQSAGFDFVDVKHCHGYLGHELLGAHTRSGDYGGSFANRTRFLREVVQAIHTEAPGLRIGVRVSAFDLVPFLPDPERSAPGRPGPGIPEDTSTLRTYLYGFGVSADDPTRFDLTETYQLFALFEKLGIRLVNVTAGSPYYNPHIQRPALYPPSDGYLPPEDPLSGVARQMGVVRDLKARFPNLFLVGSAYTYLQDFLPCVAQAAVGAGWTDSVGLGRMALSYPELPRDVLNGAALQKKRFCRTFSDCTTAPRNGLVSGCYPLDAHYKQSAEAAVLAAIKKGAKQT